MTNADPLLEQRFRQRWAYIIDRVIAWQSGGLTVMQLSEQMQGIESMMPFLIKAVDYELCPNEVRVDFARIWLALQELASYRIPPYPEILQRWLPAVGRIFPGCDASTDNGLPRSALTTESGGGDVA